MKDGKAGGAVKFMTFNVRYATRADGPHDWSQRKERLIAGILAESPEVAGLQEVLPEQRRELDAGLGGVYESVGKGRDADFQGEQCPIYYRRDLFAQLEWTTLWLSDHPNVPGSRSWKALTGVSGGKQGLPRIATCLRLLSSKGAVWSLFNTHLDHQYSKARLLAVRLLLKHVKGALDRDERVVLMGDLNAEESEECVEVLGGTLRGAFRACNPRARAPFTFHDYQGTQASGGCHIDYIFFDGHWRLISCRVLEEPGPEYLSDHFPVIAEAFEG